MWLEGGGEAGGPDGLLGWRPIHIRYKDVDSDGELFWVAFRFSYVIQLMSGGETEEKDEEE